MSSDPTLSSEELEATWTIVRTTNRRFVDRISGDTLLILYDWCASGPDRKVWPDQDVRMKVIENGMVFEFQPNELCCGWESLKGTPEEVGLRLEGSKTERFSELFLGSDLEGLRDFGEEQFRRFMIKYQNWLLPLLDEQGKEEFMSKIDGVIEFLSDKMKMKGTLVYMCKTATGNGFKGSLAFAYTKDDASPALLLLAHGVVHEDSHSYRYFAPARSDDDDDSDDDDAAAEAEEFDVANDVGHNKYPRCTGPINFPPERMDPYVGCFVVTYVDSDVESNKEALDTEDISDMESSKEALDTGVADMESSKEAPGAFYYIQATISSVDFDVDASKKRRVD